MNFGIEAAHECDEVQIESAPPTPGAEAVDSCTDSIHFRITALPPSVKSMVRKWSPGFQPEIVCQQLANDPVPSVTCIAISSAYGL